MNRAQAPPVPKNIAWEHCGTVASFGSVYLPTCAFSAGTSTSCAGEQVMDNGSHWLTRIMNTALISRLRKGTVMAAGSRDGSGPVYTPT